MTHHPLDGARERVRRAEAHFDRVQREWDAMPKQAKAVGTTTEFKATEQKIVVSIESTLPVLDQTWALEISEAIFNLRCALDYLVWELSHWNVHRNKKAPKPSWNTQFPIVSSENLIKAEQIQSLAPGHLALIKSLQPYSASNLDRFMVQILAMGTDPEPLIKKHPLFLLNTLNNHAKHRFLHVVTAGHHTLSMGAATAIDCDIGNPNYFIQAGPLQAGAKLAEFDVLSTTGPNPSVDMPIEIEPTVLYGGSFILYDFPRMRQIVTDALNMFQSVLAPP